MSFKKPTTQYWDNKFAAYMHDPFDKVFQIQRHEERAAELISLFGLHMPNAEFWKKADGIASGFERAQVPSHSQDKNSSGSVNFINSGKAIITHPTSANGMLKVELPEVNLDTVHEKLKLFIREKIGVKPGNGGYSDKFRNKHEEFTLARILYTHLALRFGLAENDVAGLGALWHRLPADTRFPDHSIWQHNALTSALYSCMELSSDAEDLGLMVFSITPVQSFISTARKLRDYWSGSVILSWLAFEGLRWVIENLGPDHVLYPSLIDQPLVNEYLNKCWQMDLPVSMSKEHSIASLPNKFLILIPFKHADKISKAISEAIHKSWTQLTNGINQWTKNKFRILNPEEVIHIDSMFKNQTETYWNMQWSAVKLLGDEDRDEIKKLLPNSAYLNQTALLDIFNKIIENKKHYEKSGKGVLYSVTHQLVQGSLAATKLKQINRRPVQHGEKCQLCGEFEVLHHRPHIDGQSASVYSANIREFWNQLRARNDNEDNKELKENERLCTICLTKRMAYRVLKSDQQHVLHSTFNEADKFQSTTQMALYSWFVKNQIPEKDWNDIADSFHDQDTAEEEKSKIKGFKSALEVKDKYYAILLMDGDKMGKLINGETIASTWESVMHPEIVSRLNNTDFIEKYRKGWSNIYKDYPRRQVTPAIHAAISEALGDFSIYGAGQIVKEYNGRLIYAGGDDVCAILPMDNVFKAALDIRNYYVSSYKFIKDNQSFDIKQEWTPQAGKLSVQLGNGKDISISAGILICHHKENLNLMIARAHQLLNYNAKKIGERNACALELKKRSGGSRQIVARWEDSEYWKHFVALQTALRRSKDQQLSRSLLYRLSRFRDGLIAINSQNQPGKLKTFILNQMEKSEIKSKDNLNEIADNVAFLLKKELDRIKNDDLNQYNVNIIDGLTIAAFMAGKEIQ